MSQVTSLDVLNPATLDLIESVPVTAPDELDGIVERSQRAQKIWAALDRQPALEKVADLIEADGEQLAQLLSTEQGKPLAEARLEVGVAARAFRYFATVSITDEVLKETEDQVVTRSFHPVGVAGLIVPWNFPLAILAWKAASALTAGNAVIAKPAPSTPLTALKLRTLMEDVLPSDLVHVVVGGGELGTRLVTHPGVPKISFTGSTATGRRIMENSADGLKRLTLELGGNDPAIILADADLDVAVSGIAAVAFRNAGQVCIAPKRIFVPNDRIDEIHDRFVSEVKRHVLGSGTESSTTLGPVHTAAQRDFVAQLVADATERGARVDAPIPSPDLPGHFVQPAVVSGLEDDAPLVAEEQFGPALPILGYDTVDEVVERANATPFGLGASVWAADADEAVTVAGRVHAGNRWINRHGPVDLDVPFGGTKQSGLGTELGRDGVKSFLEPRVLNRAR